MQTMANIQELLLRLTARDESRGRFVLEIRRQTDNPLIRIPLVLQLSSRNALLRHPLQQIKVQRSATIPDPPKLTDGIAPSYDYWSVQILGKLDVNSDHFESEKARTYYVFNCTEIDSQIHLFPRYNPDSTNPFRTAKEMITYLGDIHINPYRVRDAR
jgi:hypothetical protein